MKKTVRILAVAMALLMVMVVFASCATKLSGTYEAEGSSDWAGISLTFDGDKVTATGKILLIDVSVDGTYEIKDDKITLNFGEDKFSIGGEHDFEKDGDTIKIGGITYKKAD